MSAADEDSAFIWSNGDRVWYNDQHQLHRENGPAIVNKHTGIEIWYKNGVLHREDGPAIIFNKFNKEWWFVNGLRHRTSGPAVINKNGKDYWYLNGKRILNVEDWILENNFSIPLTPEQEILFLLRFYVE